MDTLDTSTTTGRNWIPVIVAVALVAGVVVAGLMLTNRPKSAALTAVTATPDTYSPNLPITNLAMSESSNIAGGKVTYIDGHIENTGTRTVTGILVQVLFRSYTREVAQNETIPLSVIRMRQPYIDTGSIALNPIKSGSGQDFRLIFDKVSPDWAGAIPEIRIVRVDLQ